MREQPTSPGGGRGDGPILIVDDDPDLREMMAAILIGGGHRVAEAANGREALRHLERAECPRLVILDLAMPVMDGWQLHRELQADADLAAIPVMVVSGRHDGESAAPVPADRFLRKPFDPAEFLALVASLGR